MIEHNYSRSDYDSCIYHRRLPDRSFIYLLLYIDDILIVAKNKSKIKRLKAHLSSKFEMNNLGATKNILDIEIYIN